MTRTLSHEAARRFYDRFGARQDSQTFYEDAAVAELLAFGDFEHAHNVVELGCGTGRVAEILLRDYLPKDALYLGFDVSETMVKLAQDRLKDYENRARVVHTNGSPSLLVDNGAVDRVISLYVLDIFSEADIQAFVTEAYRVLMPGGRLCVAGLTWGRGPVSAVVSAVWSVVHRVRPEIVGGCRPLRVANRLPQAEWRVHRHDVVSAWGIPSEVLIAEPRFETRSQQEPS